jgi:hypothetical protein
MIERFVEGVRCRVPVVRGRKPEAGSRRPEVPSPETVQSSKFKVDCLDFEIPLFQV